MWVRVPGWPTKIINCLSDETLNQGPVWRCYTPSTLKNQAEFSVVSSCILALSPVTTNRLLGSSLRWATSSNDKQTEIIKSNQIEGTCRGQNKCKLKNQKFSLGLVENVVGKGENAGYQHFLLFSQCFRILFEGRVMGLNNPEEKKNLLKTLWEKESMKKYQQQRCRYVYIFLIFRSTFWQ